MCDELNKNKIIFYLFNDIISSKKYLENKIKLRLVKEIVKLRFLVRSILFMN